MFINFVINVINVNIRNIIIKTIIKYNNNYFFFYKKIIS
uniref:Uncharacterized protein n=1 Tax=viral metagenome TaxID=1070528 RepID=A0A6C0LGC9_9ZZZZ